MFISTLFGIIASDSCLFGSLPCPDALGLQLNSVVPVETPCSNSVSLIASLGENLSWEKEYESLLTVEGLEAIVSQCLDKVHQLKDGEADLRLLTHKYSSLDCF